MIPIRHGGRLLPSFADLISTVHLCHVVQRMVAATQGFIPGPTAGVVSAGCEGRDTNPILLPAHVNGSKLVVNKVSCY